jgi:histidinol dehydrogenase
MRLLNYQTPVGKKLWEQYKLRQTGSSDPNYIRRDALTRKVFGRPCSAREAVTKVVQDIRRQGDVALLRYTRQIEGFRTTAVGLSVTLQERKNAGQLVSQPLKCALQKAAKHIRAFHQSQLRSVRTGAIRRKGVLVTERRSPLDRVGIYVPGGVAPLVSTVLMNAIPAQVAGVKDIVMATPPGRIGEILPAVLYAADLAGVRTVFRMGGAAAIASMAYGTQTIPAVDKIAGPANIFGTEAKRQVVGQVGIDSLAGPSEILVIADTTADPKVLAWDLLAQGEHGSGAVALLLSPSRSLLEQVQVEIKAIVKLRPELRVAQEATVLFQVKSIAQAAELANTYVPEHLSLQVVQPKQVLAKIRRVGAAFLGTNTAQAMGDYIAGSNHVLPTNRTACWSSPLSVRDFERYTSVVEYTAEGMKQEGPAAALIAETEGLNAHANSMRARFKSGLKKKSSR